jgi:hypothetical protein
MTLALKKYPRTPHLEGSRLQPGDEDLPCVPFAAIAGLPVVVEEKLDGANSAVSFDEEGRLHLQSRGHFLTGGPRERHFALFKQWGHAHARALHERLGARYVLYGEWLYARHTIYYDALPHYFVEFDVLDRETGTFLSTPRRQALLAGAPVVSAPVLYEGPATALEPLVALIGPSRFKTRAWREALGATARERGLDPARVLRETDPSDAMEGLYLKVEEEGRVTARFKWVRASFLTAVTDSGSHWLDRPIVPNRLRDDAGLYREAP